MTIKPVALAAPFGLALLALAMLGFMLAHITKNRITTGRWWP